MLTIASSDFGKKVSDEFKRIKDNFAVEASNRAIKPDGAIIEQVNADLDRLIESHGKK